MKLTHLIETVLVEQSNHFKPIAVDITIANGNILLRSFHLVSLDRENNVIKGLTQQEEYSYSREGRKPVYCFLKLEDIKRFSCVDLGLEYSTEDVLVKA
jgi:hypothetical protein